MKIKTPFTKARFRTHLTYNSWKYIAVIIASVFGWNLLYTMTAYKSPENLRIDTYIQSATANNETVDAFVKPIWDEYVPEMETVTNVLLSLSKDDYYGDMQLSVYIMAGEGDIYILSSEYFKKFASQGAFLDLTPFVESGELNTDGIETAAGYVATVDDNGLPTGDTQFFGIPAATLTGFKTGMNVYHNDLVIAVTTFSHNEENVIKYLNGLIQAVRPVQ